MSQPSFCLFLEGALRLLAIEERRKPQTHHSRSPSAPVLAPVLYSARAATRAAGQIQATSSRDGPPLIYVRIDAGKPTCSPCLYPCVSRYGGTVVLLYFPDPRELSNGANRYIHGYLDRGLLSSQPRVRGRKLNHGVMLLSLQQTMSTCRSVATCACMSYSIL
jgi:hypothetical protein